MRIEELSIGDWVKANGVAKRVHSIEYQNGEYFVHFSDPDTNSEDYMHAPFIEPIPLTPEILEKNGWSEFSDYHNSWKLDIASDKRVWMFTNSHDWTFQVMSWGLGHNQSVAKAYIKDSHELQHALRLAGIDKQIEL